MPKRGAFALVMTALAVVLLLGFRTPEDIAAITGVDQRAAVTGAVGTTGATIDGATATPGPTAVPGATDTPETTGTPGATDSPDATDGAAQTPARAFAGPVVSTRWGTVQVEITVEGGQLTDVVALQLPDGDRRSASISSRVEPTLRSQALSAQSAAIDGVSGATYTSTAYARSLQAALDGAGM
jgi:uncharacterized protein with FMN-binding domain